MTSIGHIAFDKFVTHIPQVVSSFLFGFCGYAVLGMLYYAVQRFREGRSLSPVALFRDVFPWRMYSHPTAKIDFFTWFPTQLIVYPVGAFIVAIAALLIGSDFSQILGHIFGPRAPILHSVWAIAAVQFVALFLGSEFGQYWWHRALHEVPFLWCIHRVHHSAEELVIFTGARDHPLEILTMAVAKALGSAVFGGTTLYLTGTTFSPETTIIIIYFWSWFFGFYQALSHSHIPISFFGHGNIVLGGPVMHQMHHSAETHMFDVNYGLATYLYDWMFGSLYLPRKGEKYRFGLNDYEYGPTNPHLTLREFYLRPFVEMHAHIRKRREGEGVDAHGGATHAVD